MIRRCVPAGCAFIDRALYLRPLTDLHAAEESVQGCLPIDAQATAVALVTRQSIEGPWTKAATFPLARQQPAHHEVSLEY